VLEWGWWYLVAEPVRVEPALAWELKLGLGHLLQRRMLVSESVSGLETA